MVKTGINQGICSKKLTVTYYCLGLAVLLVTIYAVVPPISCIHQALFHDAFEPYVVMRTSSMPRFNEDLLERMGDKIAYGRQVYAQGSVL